MLKAKKISKILCLLLLIVILTVGFSGCSNSKDSTVVIYTSAEDYRIEYLKKRLKEEFPKYNIVVEYLSTGNHAAKLLAEGNKTECDITYDLEYGYLQKLQNKKLLSDLSDYDSSKYLDTCIESKYYQPTEKSSGAIILNTKLLKEKNLPIPESYEDLLKPEYKGLISMPNPKSSGTGYMFVKCLVNAWGEEKAFKYFDDLSKNILQFTSSGSGPINSLTHGEVAIAISMTATAVTGINNGNEMEIKFFDEGSPYTMYGQSIIKGKENKKAVKEVYKFLNEKFSYENCEKYFPEQIFKDKTYDVKNYPKNMSYGDMKNNTLEEKERLLNKWKY